VRCTPENEHRDLYFGFPNSYGTLGYALSVRAATVPVKPFVRIAHRRFASAAAFFEALGSACAEQHADFVDGVAFGPDELRLTLGSFVEEAPYTSDYTYKNIYYRSLRERTEDYLTARDFIWRWDTDWFWCSKNVGAQNRLIRRVLGRTRLNSVTYTKIMRWNSRMDLSRKVERALGWHSESVIQDVDIPVSRAPEFLEFFVREIGILPVWICPVRAHDPARTFPLYPLQGDTLYVNFGFWDVVRRRHAFEPGHHNRLIESKVEELGGIKSLYSESYFDRDAFRQIYGGEAYDALKRKYDPDGRFPDLYDKVVLRR
jgi:FAD/FMN-containing dehydrogenase